MLLVAGLAVAAAGESLAQRSANLLDFSIEELSELRVVSVSRRGESLGDAPAAVHVITRGDIRRSGVRSIPEALRMVPGMEVARNSAHSWTISLRGFSSDLSNKLLVLVDGRTVYTPLYGGVFWDVQDVMLEDIDRIEVIAGPGGTMWGANAVNGVINIVTRSSWETEGGFVEVVSGNQERVTAALRYGTTWGDRAAARAYVKHFKREPSRTPAGDDAFDDWRMTRAGFRADWLLAGDDRLTVQGDAYTGEQSARVRGDFELGTLPETDLPGIVDVGGGNLRLYWRKGLSADATFEAQFYYDRTERDIPGSFSEDRDTISVETQHTLSVMGRHQLMWGAGVRYTRDDLDGTQFATFVPDSRSDRTLSAFLQDRIDLWQRRLFLTLGAKLEENDYTGFEYQPNARLSWYMDADSMLWAAVSRAVRVPSRIEADVALYAPLEIPGVDLPAYVNVRGNDRFADETLLAYELGYRAALSPALYLDATLFEHRYDHLMTNEGRPPEAVGAPPQYLLIPVEVANEAEGETYGGTLALRWQPAARWQLAASFSRLLFDLRLKPGSVAEQALAVAGNSPKNQFSVNSFAQLTSSLSFYVGLRYVDDLPNQGVPSYSALDISVGWQPTEALRASLTARNLGESQHPEFGSGLEMPRSAHASIEWRF